jgi:autotransporter-associated beta strand protein
MNNNSLGSTSGATSVTAGATVQIVSATSLTIPEPITINGDGIATNQGALRNPSGNNIWTGAITVGSAGARIVSGTLSGTTTDSLLITTGGINTGTASSTLILDVVKGVHIRGVISGAGALTKISADTLLLSGANSYTGATTLSAGVIQLQNQDGLGSTTAGVTGASNTSVASGTAIKIVGTGFLIPEVLSLSGLGVNAQGVLLNTSGKNSLLGDITISSDATIVSNGLNVNDSLIVLGRLFIGDGSTTNGIVTTGLMVNLDASNVLSYNSSVGGNVWKDVSGNNNNFNLSGTTFNSENGGSFVFNGSSNGKSAGSVLNVGETSKSVSWSAWVYPTTATGTIFFASSDAGGGGWNMPPLYFTNKRFMGQIYNNSVLSDVTDFTINNWYNVTLVYNKDSSHQKLYVNGNLVASQTSISYGGPGANTYLFLGMVNSGCCQNGTNFTGRMGAFNAYGNYALTPAQVLQNFNYQKGRYLNTSSSGNGSVTFVSNRAIRLSGVISGNGNVSKNGLDTLVLNATNTYTGSTNINAGTVKLGATNVIYDSADIYFNGGNLSTGFNETIRKMYLTGNSSITLGQTNHTITFLKTDSLLNNK